MSDYIKIMSMVHLNLNIYKIHEKIYFAAVAFLATATGISLLMGFGTTLASVRKQDPKSFNDGLVGGKAANVNQKVLLHETGAALAVRALGWGTLYAVAGCGVLFYGIWKMSGAKSLPDFRQRMGSILPRIPKNDPPQSRTEFKNLTDLLIYVSEDWNCEKKTTNEDTKTD